MGFLSWFGLGKSVKAVETGADVVKTFTDGIVDGLDALIYTEEERAKMSQKGAETLLEFFNVFARESSPRALARRALAVKTFDAFFALIFLGVVCRIFGVIEPKLIDVAKDLISLATSGIVGGLVLSVATTYFVPHQISKIWRGKNAKD